MNLTIDNKELCTVLHLNEEKLDTSIAPELKSEFVRLKNEGVIHLVINLKNVKYSDSSGLSALLNANRLFGDDGSFTLCEVQEHVSKLIGISQLDKVLDIVGTEAEAVDSARISELARQVNEEGE